MAETKNEKLAIATEKWHKLITSCDKLSEGTEKGVTIFSSILNSERAVSNIQIMHVSSSIRRKITYNAELRSEIEKIKRKLDNQDKNTELIFQYLER